MQHRQVLAVAPIVPVILRVIVFVLCTLLVLMAGENVLNHWDAYWCPGPNTAGEAGKVYFAQKAIHAIDVFEDGQQAPFYPTAHGAVTFLLPGMLCRLFGLESMEAIFIVGRTISVLCTLGALALAGGLIRNQSRSAWLSVLPGLFFLAIPGISTHATSFRPDAWILFLTLLTAWLSIRKGNIDISIARMLAVALTITLAVHTKAAAVHLLPASAIIFAWRYGFRWGLIVAACSMAGILLVGIAFQILSEGAYFAALLQGAGVPKSIAYPLKWLSSPALWVPLFCPILLMPWLAKDADGDLSLAWGRKAVWIFWLCAFVFEFAGAMRLGSYTYYFGGSFVLGTVLGAMALGSAIVQRPMLAGSLILLAILGITPLAVKMGSARIVDHAYLESLALKDVRRELANEVNEQRHYCFSDDPGLNILLDDPAVVDPMVASHNILGGSLDAEALLSGVRARRYDVVVLKKGAWSYLGIPHVPAAFKDLLAVFYEVRLGGGPYEIHVPRHAPKAGGREITEQNGAQP